MYLLRTYLPATIIEDDSQERLVYLIRAGTGKKVEKRTVLYLRAIQKAELGTPKRNDPSPTTSTISS